MSLESEKSGTGKMTENEVIEMISEALAVPSSAIHIDTISEDIPEWSSIGILSILSVLDDHGVCCEIGNTGALQSIKGIVDLFRASGKLE